MFRVNFFLLAVLILSSIAFLSAKARAEGIGIDANAGNWSVPVEKIEQATRGGVIEHRGVTIRVLCVDVGAETMDQCSQYALATTWPSDEGSGVRFSKHRFSAPDLSSWKAFKHAVRSSYPSYLSGQKMWLIHVFYSLMIMQLPGLISPENPHPLLSAFYLVSIPAGIASFPVTATTGSIATLIARTKTRTFLKSVVRNDRNVRIQFGKDTFWSATDSI